MADIAATDVTYTEEAGSARFNTSMRREAVFSIAFGNATLTYPSGGIPLTKGKMGCPTQIDDLIIEDASAADGVVYKWDRTNNKIRAYRIGALDGNAAAAQNLTEFVAATTAPAATTLKARVVGY